MLFSIAIKFWQCKFIGHLTCGQRKRTLTQKNDTKVNSGRKIIYLWDEIRLARVLYHSLAEKIHADMSSEFKMTGGFLPHLVYILTLPSFFLGSSLLYNPFGIKEYYTFGSFSFGFHLVMLSCIILLCAAIMRTALFILLRKQDILWWHYGMWCFSEMTVMSAFAALYTILFKGAEGGYFAILPVCMEFIFLSLCYPYIFLIFVRIIRLKNEEIERKNTSNDNSLVRFLDEHKRLKLSIAPSSILYVSSEFNYVKIFYLDGEKVKHFMLRASMKSLEAMGNKALVRCQRSYFVNPAHVSVLRKDSEGFIFAEMNVPGLPAVPVSKQYYDVLAALL